MTGRFQEVFWRGKMTLTRRTAMLIITLMRQFRRTKTHPVKNWWRYFFTPEIGRLLFAEREDAALSEIHTVLKRTGLRQGAKILDLCCGTGRHSFALAQQGFHVVGLDITRSYINEANQKLANAQLCGRLEFVCADMREVAKHFKGQQFDAVINLFNSFGYFYKKSDDLSVLRQISKILKPGGKLVINTLNRSGVEYRLVRIPRLLGRKCLHFWNEEKPGFFFLDEISYDQAKRRTQAHWLIIEPAKSRIERLRFSQNVYSLFEFKRMLSRCGMQMIRHWGMLQGKPYNAKSWHITFVAKKV